MLLHKNLLEMLSAEIPHTLPSVDLYFMVPKFWLEGRRDSEQSI